MDNSLVTTDSQFGVSTIVGTNGSLVIGKPFVQTIYLTSVDVAGTYYVGNIEELLEELKEGERLRLVREPDNQYDKFAIRIDNDKGEKLGYIPRQCNHIPARLMDAGKCLYATVQTKQENTQFRVEIYMED